MNTSTASAMKNTQIFSQITSWLADTNSGYFVTLNTLKCDRIQFEADLRKLAHKLNGYCYGRSYERKEKELKIVAGIETGKVDSILHAHLIIQLQYETTRTLLEIDSYIRKNWCQLIGISDIPFGSMINVQHLGETSGRVAYIVKDTHYWLQNDDLNIVVL